MSSRKRRVWWDEGKAAGFLTWAGGFAVSRVACEFCARSNCVNANRDIRLFPRSKKLHAYLPLPLLAADVGCWAGTWRRLGTVSVPSFWRAIHNRSSGIGRCSRARSPNGQLGGKLGLDLRSRRGLFVGGAAAQKETSGSFWLPDDSPPT
jgi:hypothetical protein